MDDGRNDADAVKFDHLLAAWYRRARESQLSHYKVATFYAARARRLGVATVILSALTGTTLFATLEETAGGTTIHLALGLCSITAAVLAALHTSLGYSERANQHRAAGTLYGSIRREMERYQAFRPAERDDAIRVLEGLRTRIDEAATAAPDVPERLWRQAQADIKHTSRPEGFTRGYWELIASPGDES
jgi:hypothetical protein